MTPREHAIQAIKEGGMVVVNSVVYTMSNLEELPPLEDFVKGDASAEASALETLKKEKEELEKRLAALEKPKVVAEKKEETKVVAKKEATE